MLAKYTLGALIAVMAHGATAAFNTSCSWWSIHGDTYLFADCIDSTSGKDHRIITSTLDLNRCIGISERNSLIWKPK